MLSTGLRVLVVLLVAAIAATARPAHAQQNGTIDYGLMVGAIVDGYAVPAAARLAEAADKLAPAIEAACAGPTAENKAAVAAAFTETVAAHGRLAVLRFGALADAHRLERLAFLPDSRGVVRRQLDRLLASKDAAALDPATLAGKSVALQGLTALERLVYSSDAMVALDSTTPEGDYACTLAVATATVLANTAQEIHRAYEEGDGQTGLLLSPGPDNPLAHSGKEAVGQVFNALMTGLAVLRDQVVERVLEPGGNPDSRAARAPFDRSDNALVHIAAGLEGLKGAIDAGGFTAATPNVTWIGNTLAFETDNATKALRGLPPHLATVLADDAMRGRLAYVEIVTKGLRDMLAGELAGWLELEGGFNALDGD